jgi:hypothetical protein
MIVSIFIHALYFRNTFIDVKTVLVIFFKRKWSKSVASPSDFHSKINIIITYKNEKKTTEQLMYNKK